MVIRKRFAHLAARFFWMRILPKVPLRTAKRQVNAADFFFYLAVVFVIATWVFLIAGLFDKGGDSDYPFGIDKQTASRILMFAGLFMAVMLTIKFLLL